MLTAQEVHRLYTQFSFLKVWVIPPAGSWRLPQVLLAVPSHPSITSVFSDPMAIGRGTGTQDTGVVFFFLGQVTLLPCAKPQLSSL